jgi:hypothetical protein
MRAGLVREVSWESAVCIQDSKDKKILLGKAGGVWRACHWVIVGGVRRYAEVARNLDPVGWWNTSPDRRRRSTMNFSGDWSEQQGEGEQRSGHKVRGNGKTGTLVSREILHSKRCFRKIDQTLISRMGWTIKTQTLRSC